jgi:hypothetical protein
MEENNIKTDVIALVTELKTYINLRSTLLSYQIRKSAAELIASLSSSVFIIIFASMSFVFGSFALAYYLAEEFGSFSKGFLCVAGIYFALLMIAFMLRKPLKNIISNTIIKELFKDENHGNN